MDIILSISLLASDRRESLERCLDSLKPLLVKIPSELIIVFTGTSGDTESIAEKYTPHVIPFQWCGDFSAARNAGLKEARGEWFLYLDDDEWFEDVDEICDFFLSGEYRHYHSAHYIQRNYLDWNGTKHSDFSAFRMVRRLPETHFQNPIHEELTPRREPCKYFWACVHHYGYIKESGTGNSRKTSRNIPLLLQSVQEQPSFVKNYLQLAKEYDLEGDWRAAEEYCRKGRDICRDSGDPYSKGWLQAYLSHLLCGKPGKQESILEIEGIIKKEHPSELPLLVLYQQLICLYKENREPEKAVQTGMEFENLLKEMDKKEYLWEKQSYGEFNEGYVKNPERLYSGRAVCTACALELQDWENAAYFLGLFPWEEEDILCRYYPDFEEWRAACGSSFRSVLFRLFRVSGAQGNPKPDTQRASRNICPLGTGGLCPTMYDTPGISDTLNTVETPGVSGKPAPLYILLIKALYFLEDGDKNQGADLYIKCMEQADEPFLQQVLLKEALRNQIDVSPLAVRMDLDAWDACTAEAAASLPFPLADQVLGMTEKLLENAPFHGLCLKKKVLELKLLKGFYLWDKLTAALEEYCQCILAFYKSQYKEEMFGEELHVFLPGECRFAMTALEALVQIGQGQMAESVRLFRKCIRIYPSMTGVLGELLRQAVRRANDPALHAGEEFRQLAGQMKGTLKILLDAGETMQAGGILNQLLPLMPEDTELIRMRQELIRK